MIEPLSAERLAVQLGGRTLFAGLDAVFQPGRVTCVIGPNGAGKSTLMACLAGLRRPDAGTARLGGAPVLDMGSAARARRIGFLPQTPEIAWPIEVAALVALGRTPYRSSGSLTGFPPVAAERSAAKITSCVFIASSRSGRIGWPSRIPATNASICPLNG